jgi:hypothetical protein
MQGRKRCVPALAVVAGRARIRDRTNLYGSISTLMLLKVHIVKGALLARSLLGYFQYPCIIRCLRDVSGPRAAAVL